MMKMVARLLGISLHEPRLTPQHEQEEAERRAHEARVRLARLNAWTEFLSKRAYEQEKDVRDRFDS